MDFWLFFAIGMLISVILVGIGIWVFKEKELKDEERKEETKLILEKLERIEEKLDKDDSKRQD